MILQCSFPLFVILQILLEIIINIMHRTHPTFVCIKVFILSTCSWPYHSQHFTLNTCLQKRLHEDLDLFMSLHLQSPISSTPTSFLTITTPLTSPLTKPSPQPPPTSQSHPRAAAPNSPNTQYSHSAVKCRLHQHKESRTQTHHHTPHTRRHHTRN